MLPDIQESRPKNTIYLNRVGISKLTLPVFIEQRDRIKVQHTVAKISCYVDLEAEKKGINMSRLPIILQGNINIPLKGSSISDIAEEIRVASEAKICHLTYEFPYFTIKQSPVTSLDGMLDHKVVFDGVKTENDFLWKFSVETIGTTLCPCSKEISKFGAHNQKCYITMTVKPKPNLIVWIEDLIDIANKSSSCEIFSVLKRPDEKWVTEFAYNNPMFVEDVARHAYQLLSNNNSIESFQIKAASDESIHVHRAEAIIEGGIVS